MRTARKINYHPVSAIMNKKQLCVRINHSVNWFDQNRPKMEQNGFPKYDHLLRGWLIMAVDAWLSKRAKVPDTDQLEEQIALARIYENT